MSDYFQLIYDKWQVSTASLQKDPSRISKLMWRLRKRIIDRVAEEYDILPARLDVLWVPEKCDAMLFERPCCGSLIRSAVSIRQSTSSILADSLCGDEDDVEVDVSNLAMDSALMLICEESGEESRYQRSMANDCDVLGSILIEEMRDPPDGKGELLYMLCGCYMKTVTGTENTAITVTVYGYTHVSDATLHGAKHKLIVRGNPSRFTPHAVEPADRILEVLRNFQTPIHRVLKRIDQARATTNSVYASDCDEDADSLDPAEDYDIDAAESAATSPPPTTPQAVFNLEEIVKSVEEPDIFHSWIYIPGGYSPEWGQHESTPLTVAFQSRAKIILQTIVEMWADNETALHYFHKRNITYRRSEYLQVDRTVMSYLALAVCHQPEWSEMFVDGVSRLCEKLYDQVKGVDDREMVLRINNIRLKPIDIRSHEESHGKAVQKLAAQGLTQIVDMWRRLMAVDLDEARATKWPHSMPTIIENFLEASWTYLENEFQQ